MTQCGRFDEREKRLQTVLVSYWGEINADGTISYGYERRFELIEEEDKEMKKFTKSDLRCGDVVFHRCGWFVIGNEEDLAYINDNYDDELRAFDCKTDIMKVYRNPLWDREEETITRDEKVLLKNIAKIFKYIARNRDSTLFVYGDEPAKEVREVNMWIRRPDSYIANLAVYVHLFPMVKWEDDEPWKIEDLLKLDVKKDG